MNCPNCRKALPDGAAECGSCGVIVAKFQAKASRTPLGGSADAVSAPDPAEVAAQARRGAWFYRTVWIIYAFTTLPALLELPRMPLMALTVLAGHGLLAWHLREPSLLSWSFLAAPALALWSLLLFAFTKMGDGPMSAMAFMMGAPLFAFLTAALFGLMIYRPGRNLKPRPPR